MKKWGLQVTTLFHPPLRLLLLLLLFLIVKEHVRMMPYNGSPDQQWVVAGNRIINRVRPSECFTDKEGDKPVHVKMYKSKPQQHWRVEYVM